MPDTHRRELTTIAETLARTMANTNGQQGRPDVSLCDGIQATPQFAVAGDVAQFTIETLFGFDVCVSVHIPGGAL